MNTPELQTSFDQQHIWHPYSAIPPSIAPLLVKKAQGCELILDDDTHLIDGMASWWSVIHGYNHPLLNQALKSQIDKVSHVMFGGLTHEPAIELSRLLIDITAPELDKVFLADSGSVAVEVAMKMAVQYWRSLPEPKPDKSKFLTIKQGYHGDTLNAMSVCDPDNGIHQVFGDWVPKQFFARSPGARSKTEWQNTQFDEQDIEDFKHQIQTHHSQIAAVILEPICQGAGGMRFYSPEFLRQVKKLCEQYDVLLILDEIATGFGRTGELFAYEHTGNKENMIAPDILCLGKALTGGYMSLAAVLTTDKISSTISNGQVKAFMHGPTFMGNPLACAVAIESIKLLINSPWKKNVSMIETQLHNELSPLRDNNQVVDVRVLGAIGVVEMKQDIDMAKTTAFFKNKGVWLRPFGKLLYLMPPYIISASQLTQITRAMGEFVETKFIS